MFSISSTQLISDSMALQIISTVTFSTIKRSNVILQRLCHNYNTQFQYHSIIARKYQDISNFDLRSRSAAMTEAPDKTKGKVKAKLPQPPPKAMPISPPATTPGPAARPADPSTGSGSQKLGSSAKAAAPAQQPPGKDVKNVVQGPPCTVFSSESPAGKDVKNVVQGPPCTVYSSESRRGLDNRPKTPPKSDGPGPAKQPVPPKTPMEQQKKQAPGLVPGRGPLSEGEMMAFQASWQATRPPGPQQTLQGMAQSQMATSAHEMKMMEPTAQTMPKRVMNQQPSQWMPPQMMQQQMPQHQGMPQMAMPVQHQQQMPQMMMQPNQMQQQMMMQPPNQVPQQMMMQPQPQQAMPQQQMQPNQAMPQVVRPPNMKTQEMWQAMMQSMQPPGPSNAGASSAAPAGPSNAAPEAATTARGEPLQSSKHIPPLPPSWDEWNSEFKKQHLSTPETGGRGHRHTPSQVRREAGSREAMIREHFEAKFSVQTEHYEAKLVTLRAELVAARALMLMHGINPAHMVQPCGAGSATEGEPAEKKQKQ